MPRCSDTLCRFPTLPLFGVFACILCDAELHAVCGTRVQQHPKFSSVCCSCRMAVEQQNNVLRSLGVPELPLSVMVAERNRELGVSNGSAEMVLERSNITGPALAEQSNLTGPPLDMELGVSNGSVEIVADSSNVTGPTLVEQRNLTSPPLDMELGVSNGSVEIVADSSNVTSPTLAEQSNLSGPPLDTFQSSGLAEQSNLTGPPLDTFQSSDNNGERIEFESNYQQKKRSADSAAGHHHTKERRKNPPKAPTVQGVPKNLIVSHLLRSNASCAGCGLSCSNAYRCKHCNSAVHHFCAVDSEELGHGAHYTCPKCHNNKGGITSPAVKHQHHVVLRSVAEV
jgi:hypothetical protein